MLTVGTDRNFSLRMSAICSRTAVTGAHVAWVPTTCVTWADALQGASRFQCRASRRWPSGRAMIFACGREAGLPDRIQCHVVAQVVAGSGERTLRP
jgi:hypothetical protein